MADFEKIAKELQQVDEKGLSQVSKLANMQLHIEERIDLLEIKAHLHLHNTS